MDGNVKIKTAYRTFYGIGVILLTVAGIFISVIGPLNSGMVHNAILVSRSGKRRYRWIHWVKHSLYNWNIRNCPKPMLF